MIRNIAMVLCLLQSIVILCSLFIAHLTNTIPIYLLLWCFSVILVVVFHKDRKPRTTLTFMYITLIVMYGYTALLSYFSMDGPGVAIVGFFALAPLVILDSSKRINWFMAIAFIFYMIMVVFTKPHSVMTDDFLGAFSFLIVGIVIGDQTRHIKLMNLENQRQLQIISDRDSLTQLSNRHKLLKVLEDRSNYRSFTGAMMLDIDLFKKYNDSYGHMQGDTCLQQIGNCLKANSNHEFFRFGGEEFITFFHGESEEEIIDLAHQVQQRIASLDMLFEQSPYGVVTASIGYAHLSGQTPRELMRCADIALYKAKTSGRNTIVAYGEDLPNAMA